MNNSVKVNVMAKRSAQDWLDEIDNALKYREVFGREAAWKKIEQNYTNDPNGDTAIGPNIVYSMGDSLMSSLMVPDPEFVVEPEKIRSIKTAPVVESMDNYFVRKLHLKRYIDVAVLRGYLYGAIILKIGYDSEFGWSPYYDIGQGNQLMGLTFTQFDQRGRRIETGDTQPGWPWVRPVLPHDFVVPWGTIFLEDAPWMAYRFVRHINSIKKDPKYKNTSRLTGKISMEDYMCSYMSVAAKDQRSYLKGIAEHNKKPDYVEGWEITDRENGEVHVVVKDHDRFLRDEPDALQLSCGVPYVHSTLSQHPRSFWSVPPAYYLGQLQNTQFDISKQADKQRRISVLKFLYRDQAIDQEDLDRILDSDVGVAAKVKGAYPLNEVIAPLNTGNTFDHTIHSQEVRQDAREAIGFSRNQLGEFDTSSRRTAREATFVAAGSQRRMNKREQGIAWVYTDLIGKLNKLVFDYWQIPREIMSDGGFVTATGPELKGDYLYDISLSTKRQISRAERKIEALTLLPQLAQIPGADIGALMQYLEAAAGDPHFSAILAPMMGQGNRQLPAAQGALPTIPATQTQG